MNPAQNKPLQRTPEEIDTTVIIFKTKVTVQTPLKSLLTVNGNGNGHDHSQTTLFEPTVHYGLNGNGHARQKRKAAHNKGLSESGVASVKKRKYSK